MFCGLWSLRPHGVLAGRVLVSQWPLWVRTPVTLAWSPPWGPARSSLTCEGPSSTQGHIHRRGGRGCGIFWGEPNLASHGPSLLPPDPSADRQPPAWRREPASALAAPPPCTLSSPFSSPGVTDCSPQGADAAGTLSGAGKGTSRRKFFLTRPQRGAAAGPPGRTGDAGLLPKPAAEAHATAGTRLHRGQGLGPAAPPGASERVSVSSGRPTVASGALRSPR